MQANAGTLVRFSDRIFAYLPTLAAGLAVLALGIAAGWVAKRVVVRALIWLRLDKLGGRSGWRAAFGKGDVRAAMYDLVGTLVMAAVVILFLENALQIWGLTVLSRLIDRFILYVPNLGIAAFIIGVGIVVSNVAGDRVSTALEEEGFERGRLLGRILKGVLQAVVGVLALWQIGFARQLVLSAFLITFGAVGVAFALAVGIGAARAVQSSLERWMGKDKD